MSWSWRRFRNFSFAALAALVVLAIADLYEIMLRDASYMDGWILLASMVVLAMFNARKKFPMLPLLAAKTWMQVHIYVGWFAVGVFFVHTGLELPNGTIETALWCAFVAVALSGVFGAFFSTSAPARLTRHGEPVGRRRHGERFIYERIPAFRAEIAVAAEELANKSVRETKSSIISDYYVTRLEPFFRKPRNVLLHLFDSDKHLHTLRSEMRALERYLDDKGRDILIEMSQLVGAKDNLDFYRALQLTLKGWLFVHIPLTYGLVVLVVVHVLMVYGFSAGAP